jgi:2-alkenal reductase
VNRFARYVAVFLIALLGGAVGAGGAWYLVSREPARTVQAEVVVATPLPPSPTLELASATPLPLPTAAQSPTATPPPPTSTTTPYPTWTPLPALAEIVARANPSIVTVINARSVPGINNSTSEQLVWGSGVIIDSRGYVLTNEHVAAAAQELVVTLYNGRTAAARYIAGDALADLALIKIERDLPFQKLAWGDSTRVRLGDSVAVIGSPLGNLRNSVTVGVISGLDRTVYLGATDEVAGLIQTDAAINRGNSGGALIDTRGRLIGVVTLIIRQTSITEDPTVQGIGFAIPSNDARALAEEWVAEDN